MMHIWLTSTVFSGASRASCGGGKHMSLPRQALCLEAAQTEVLEQMLARAARRGGRAGRRGRRCGTPTTAGAAGSGGRGRCWWTAAPTRAAACWQTPGGRAPSGSASRSTLTGSSRRPPPPPFPVACIYVSLLRDTI